MPGRTAALDALAAGLMPGSCGRFKVYDGGAPASAFLAGAAPFLWTGSRAGGAEAKNARLNVAAIGVGSRGSTDGHSAGALGNMVACCDVAIGSHRATFCLSEVKLGLIPAVISPYVVGAIGPRAARRYFQSAEMFDAVEAHRIGLLHEVVGEDELSSAVEKLSLALLKNGPASMAAAKDLVARVSRGPLDGEMVQDTAERIAAARTSAEGREGVAAFLEKRNPAWVKG